VLLLAAAGYWAYTTFLIGELADAAVPPPPARTVAAAAPPEAAAEAPAVAVVPAPADLGATPAAVAAPEPGPGMPAAPIPAPAAGPDPVVAAYVEALEVNLVRDRGSMPGVVIRRVLVTPGELVEPAHDLRFEGFNTDQRLLVFVDSAGARYYRRY
jgi:hypothetical protein